MNFGFMDFEGVTLNGAGDARKLDRTPLDPVLGFFSPFQAPLSILFLLSPPPSEVSFTAGVSDVVPFPF